MTPEELAQLEYEQQRNALLPPSASSMKRGRQSLLTPEERLQVNEAVLRRVAEQATAPTMAAPSPLGAASQDENRAIAELQAAQQGQMRPELGLAVLRGGQLINQAWTGAPVDVQGLQAMQETIQRPATEAAQRLALAREFAKRRIEGEQVERQLAQRQAFAAQEQQQIDARLQLERDRMQQAADLEREQLELRRQIEERQAEAERRRAMAKPRGPDALTQRKRELEIAKLEKELAAGPEDAATLEKRVKEERARAELTGQPTAAEKKKQREQMVEIRDRSSNIQRNLEELERLIEEEGTYNVVGAHNKKISSRIYQIAVDTAKLVDPTSVAREGEVAAAQRYMLFEPSPFIRDSTAKEIISEFKRDAAARLKSAYDVRGIQPFEESETQQAPSWSADKQKRLEELRAKQAKGGE